jgi:DUF3047 family protein
LTTVVYSMAIVFKQLMNFSKKSIFMNQMNSSIHENAGIIIGLCTLIFFTISLNTHAEEYYLEENFDNMNSWEALKFKKIKQYTDYSIIKIKPNQSILKIVSKNSASAIIFKKKYDVAKWPVIEWRWKVENVLENGDATKKSGDDYPIRIYILFEYNPEKSGFFEKAKYGAAKLLYGKYPPFAALNYIWANQNHSQKIIPNAYTSKAMMILSDFGEKHVGEWRAHRVNVVEDYKNVFRESPPSKASLAIMGDSDNTGGAATAYIDYIRVIQVK